MGTAKHFRGRKGKIDVSKGNHFGFDEYPILLSSAQDQLLPSGLQLDSEAMKVSEAGGDNPETDTALPQ